MRFDARTLFEVVTGDLPLALALLGSAAALLSRRGPRARQAGLVLLLLFVVNACGRVVGEVILVGVNAPGDWSTGEYRLIRTAMMSWRSVATAGDAAAVAYLAWAVSRTVPRSGR